MRAGIERGAGQRLQGKQGFRRQCQRHQRRFRRHHGQAELLRQLVAERAGPDLRHRQAARGDHQRLAAEGAALRGHGKPHAVLAFDPCHLPHGAGHGPLHPGVIAGVLQHVDDVLRRLVAEKLAVFALVVRNAAALDHLDEIVLRKAGQGRAAKVRILRQVILCPHAAVAEIAAPAARNANALAELCAMVEQQHAPPAHARLCGAHHAGSAGTDHDDIE